MSSGVGGPGTLLGPEGPGFSNLENTAQPSAGPTPTERLELFRARGGLGPALRPYLENYTVDASIFVAKLLRAHGGCLGIRSR